MRKASIFAMAALALLTAQCKKNEPKPEEKVMVPITGSVDFGGGSKTEITTTGMIYPKDDDVIYIYDNGTYVGSMTCKAQTGQQQFTCSGTIQQTSLEHTCTFMYLGSNNGINGQTSSTISFADQKEVSVSNDGKISGLEKFHVGSCQAQVSTDGKVTLPMATKMSIAYFKLTDGTSPIDDQDVTISGSGVYATATISKTDGTLVGSGTGNITVHTDDDGCFYMALIPKSGEVIFTFSVEGYENATNEFLYGIRECCFYSEHGSGNPLPVTMTPKPGPKFTVGMDGATPRTVEFAPGNLQYLGNLDGTGTWRFAEHQWDYMGDGPASGTTNQGNVDLSSLGYSYGMYNTGSGNAGGDETDADKAAARDLFGWGCTGCKDTRYVNHTNWYQTNYQPYSTSNTAAESGTDAYNINRFGYGPDYVSSPYYNLTVENNSDWGCVTGLPSAGEGKSWRTLGIEEWTYLLNKSNVESGARTDVNRFAMARVNGVVGLLIFPDGYNNGTAISGITGIATVNNIDASYPDVSISSETWTSMESAGAVFLPAAGFRDGASVSYVGSRGYYWSSSCVNSFTANNLNFNLGFVHPSQINYHFWSCCGRCVRLVSEN